MTASKLETSPSTKKHRSCVVYRFQRFHQGCFIILEGPPSSDQKSLGFISGFLISGCLRCGWVVFSYFGGLLPGSLFPEQQIEEC